jgi:shikimate kinase
MAMTTSIGRRIHVIGNSCSGKSTLGARLAAILDLPFVELDALN